MAAVRKPTFTNTHRLRNVYERHLDVMAQLVERDQWTIDEIDADHKHFLEVVGKLSGMDAAINVGESERPPDDSGKRHSVVQWEWRQGVREKLERYIDSVERFDCEHRVHIHKVDGRFGCQYCDEPRDYDRDRVEEAMFA